MKYTLFLAATAMAATIPDTWTTLKPEGAPPAGASDSHDGAFGIQIINAGEPAPSKRGFLDDLTGGASADVIVTTDLVSKISDAGAATAIADDKPAPAPTDTTEGGLFDGIFGGSPSTTTSPSATSTGGGFLDGIFGGSPSTTPSATATSTSGGFLDSLFGLFGDSSNDKDTATTATTTGGGFLDSLFGGGSSAASKPTGDANVTGGSSPAPVQQINDGQLQNPQAAPVQQINDGQIQNPQAAPVQQITDGQIQNPQAAPVQQITDGQIQNPQAAPVQQITDGQIQNPGSAPAPAPAPENVSPKPDAPKPDASEVQQITDGQIQNPVSSGPKPDADKPDAGKPDAGTPEAGKPDSGNPGNEVQQITDGQIQNPGPAAPGPAAPGPNDKPDDSKPEDSKPEDSKPEDSKPGDNVQQITDGQIQNPGPNNGGSDGAKPDNNGAEQINDGQVQNQKGNTAATGGRPQACSSDTALKATLKDGILRDSKGRVGLIVSNRQFQFDGPPPQAGAIYANGWSITKDGYLALGSSDEFFQCLLGDFYNLYDQNVAAQCHPVKIQVIEFVQC